MICGRPESHSQVNPGSISAESDLNSSLDRILITGGSGFIGTNLVEYFSKRGRSVINLDISPPRNKEHGQYWCKVNLIDGPGLRECICTYRPRYIIHLAARTDLEGRSLSDYAANIAGLENLLASVEGLGSLQRVLFASSRLVCRIGYEPKSEEDYCPSTMYGESKMVGEQIVRDSRSRIPCPWIMVRPTSIWGPWFDVPYKNFFLAVASGRYFHPGRDPILKSFGFVGNTIYQISCLLDAPLDALHGRTLYLADYPPVNLAEMAEAIRARLDAPRIQTVPPSVLRLAAWSGDLMKKLGLRQPPLTSFRLRNLRTEMVHDLEPLRKVAGQLPYSLREGVDQTVTWLAQQGQL